MPTTVKPETTVSSVSVSTSACAIWAKTDGRGAEPMSWSPLLVHLEDTGRVAAHLYDHWLSDAIRARLIEAAGDEDSARALCILVATAHDAGKATPAFAVQVASLRDDISATGLPIPLSLPDRAQLPHALAGQVIVERWLSERGVARQTSQSLASVIGAHHGVPPSRTALNFARADVVNMGGDAWVATQDEILDFVAARLGLQPLLRALDNATLTQDILITLAGIVVVADWLASSADNFRLFDIGEVIDLHDGEARFIAAKRGFALPTPWAPHDDGDDAHSLLVSRFALPPGARAYPAQVEAVAVARSMTTPGMIVIEAPCGDGKSEAALLAAEVLAARFGMAGVMVALPTQATSNSMFTRVLPWLIRASNGEGDGSAVSVYLANGKSSQQATFRNLRMTRSLPSDIGRDEATGSHPYVDSWMTGRRKGVLADVVVGTIDQALVAALSGRYVQLRHLALTRKVVILDEVHAFDAYTSDCLKALLRWLGAHGVPVVALSATLTDSLRADLLAAYEHGRLLHDAATGAATDARTPRAIDKSSFGDGDSCITWSQPGALSEVRMESAGRRYQVLLEHVDDTVPALVELVEQRLGEPRRGCVLIICNTVGRAQVRYAALKKALGDDTVTLAHSRFTASARRRNDDLLVRDLGKPGDSSQRPEARVVVSTQVAEQSLDIDADLLITDLAPIDMIVQRIGRLHRHDRRPEDRGPLMREPRCVITGVGLGSPDGPELDRDGTFVYGEFPLIQAAGLCLERLSAGMPINIPADVGPLVERAYLASPTGPESWTERTQVSAVEFAREAERSTERARVSQLPVPGGASVRAVNLTGLLEARLGDEYVDADSPRAQVRDGLMGIEVLLVTRSPSGAISIPKWLDDDNHGVQLATHQPLSSDLVETLSSCTVRLQDFAIQGEQGNQLVDALEQNHIPAWRSTPELSGQLLLPLDEKTLTAKIAGFTFSYNQSEGLRMVTSR